MVGIIVAVASVATFVGASLAIRGARLRVVEDAFRSLGGEPRRTLQGVEGPIHGLPVRYWFRANNRRSFASRMSTFCTAVLSVERPPFEMDLRPQTGWATWQVEHGRAIDLVLGDEAFDDSFLVEAAPSDMAHALIDRDTRTAMLSFYPCQLRIVGDELRFIKTTSLDDFAEVRRVLELVTRVRARLDSLPALLHEQRLALAREGAAAAGYRGPSARDMSALAVSSGSAAELDALRRIRAHRTVFRVAQVVAIAAAWIAIWLWLGHR